jgi:hypothetical protein
MVREGINAYRAGRKEEARTLLLRAVEIDQYNEQAWLWLSAVVESTDEQRTCLENVLTINPNNERAKQGLAMMGQKSAAPPKPDARQEKPAFDDSFPAAASSAAPKAPPTAEEDELPATIWGDAPVTASSSASSNYRVNEPSSQEYDDWVSNLGLGGQTPAQKQIDPSQFSFGMDEEDDDDEVADLNDLRSTLAQMDEESPFGPFGMTDTPAQPMPAARASSKPGAPPLTRQPERQTHDALLDAIEDDEADDLEFGGEDEDEFGDDSIGKLDASEFFQYIPKEITATRMPGTRERAPLLPLLGVLLFLAANIGAVIFFISRMTGAA